MAVVWYDRYDVGETGRRWLTPDKRAWRMRSEGANRPIVTAQACEDRLAALRGRYHIDADGFLVDKHAGGRGAGGGGVGGMPGDAGVSVASVPCMLWAACDRILREAIARSEGKVKPPDRGESAFLLDKVLALDAEWEFTHASASDGSRGYDEDGILGVSRAAVIHDGRALRMLGGAMKPVEGNFDQHSFEAELEAMTDAASAVRADASKRWGGGGRWLNITDCLSGAQAELSYRRRSDNARTSRYRFERLAGLEAMQAGMDAGVQVWVHSHGTGGGFAVNEAADILATEYRTEGVVRPGVRLPPTHVCAVIEEVKRSHAKYMLEALQAYAIDRLLERSIRTLRTDGAWSLFTQDPVSTGVLPTGEVFDLLRDAHAHRLPGMVGESPPDGKSPGRFSRQAWLRARGCPCGNPSCDQTVLGTLTTCGFADEARTTLSRGMESFAARCDPVYAASAGWGAACALVRGEPVHCNEAKAIGKSILLGLPPPPPLGRDGRPVMELRAARLMGRSVHLRVKEVFDQAEEGRQSARSGKRTLPLPAAARSIADWRDAVRRQGWGGAGHRDTARAGGADRYGRLAAHMAGRPGRAA